MIQLSVMKITGYGPWTLTLGSDREHRLQMLQAALYGRVQELFSERNALVFHNRADEFFAVTNGLGLRDHAEIQAELGAQFDVKLSVSVGSAQLPFDANLAAHKARLGRPADERHDIYGSPDADRGDAATVMHLDVEDLTGRTRSATPYEVSGVIFDLLARMSRFFLGYGFLSFFMGGDNFMVVSGAGARGAAEAFLAEMRGDGVEINCGIGTGVTGRQAAELATASLDAIRDMRDSGRPKPSIYEMQCS